MSGPTLKQNGRFTPAPVKVSMTPKLQPTDEQVETMAEFLFAKLSDSHRMKKLSLGMSVSRTSPNWENKVSEPDWSNIAEVHAYRYTARLILEMGAVLQ